MNIIRKKFVYQLFFLLAVMSLTSCLSRPERLQTRYPADTNRALPPEQLTDKYAEVIGVGSDEIRNIKLYEYIDEWMGIPHRLGGNDKNGVDCSAFANYLVQHVYGKSLPRTASEMAEVVKRKYESNLKEGDLVFFNFGGRKFDHVGVYLKNNKFVHVSTSKGVIISDLRDPWYRKYFTRAGSVL